MSWIDVLGYAASASVLVTFCMSTMMPLRVVALISNVLFCLYGYFDHLYPVLILHAVLFPVNALKLAQFHRLVRAVRAAHRNDLSIEGLLPFMTVRKLAAGETLVRKGEKADRLYYLVDGQLELVEFGDILEPGAVVGEIGVFSKNHERTATVVSRRECRLYELSESKATQLYFQDRSFGFAVLQLIIIRLLEDSARIRQAREA